MLPSPPETAETLPPDFASHRSRQTGQARVTSGPSKIFSRWSTFYRFGEGNLCGSNELCGCRQYGVDII